MTIVLLQPDGVQITAQAARQGNAAVYGGGAGRPLGGRSGFRVDTASNVLTASSTTWTLGPCSAMIDPGAATHQGMYGWASDQNITGSVTAADATYGRIDIVYILVNDSSAGDGSGALNANPVYLAGTPSATPVAPTVPPRGFLVGTITVPKSGGGSPTVALNPARFVAAGATLPVYSLAERDALVKHDGLTVRRVDVAGRPLETWDGAEWQRFSRSYAKATGKFFWGSMLAGAATGPNYQAFPAGKFSVPPIVLMSSDQTRVSPAAVNVTKDGFDLYVNNFTSGASAAGEIRWSAEQMTATSATG